MTLDVFILLLMTVGSVLLACVTAVVVAMIRPGRRDSSLAGAELVRDLESRIEALEADNA